LTTRWPCRSRPRFDRTAARPLCRFGGTAVIRLADIFGPLMRPERALACCPKADPANFRDGW
jgi:hypothetical protein